MGWLGRKRGRFSKLPLAKGWTKYRDLPAPEGAWEEIVLPGLEVPPISSATDPLDVDSYLHLESQNGAWMVR